LEIIRDAQSGLRERSGESIKVISASDSRHTVYSENGMDVSRVLEAKSRGDIRKSGYRELVFDEIFSLKTEAIVDVASATPDGIAGRDLYLKAFGAGKDIVTANKSPLALHWEQIMDECKQAGRRIRFESTVAGGVPLFNLRDFSIIPSEVLQFRGVVSSSVNIILNDIINGRSFESSVEYAIKQGIAETNYHDDTLGLDAARKTVILANALFGTNLTLNDIQYEGVEGNMDKVSSLKGKGGLYRVVSSIRKEGSRTSVFSGIEEIGEKDPLRALGNESLGYTMRTDMNGEVLVVGLEDTPLETASGVVNDIALLAKTRA
ncbi:MAG TPA: homoserine dehydrogenase, partial [Thermoplasmataceae archaeon]|nr:homoserine dehydrogenase [Thermoplasmataceae archaeon]